MVIMEQSPYPAGFWFVLLLLKLLLLMARMCMGFCSCTGGGSAVEIVLRTERGKYVRESACASAHMYKLT